MANNPHAEWDNGLPYVLWAYRETTHKIIEFFPYRILFGNEMKILLDQLVRYGRKREKRQDWCVRILTHLKGQYGVGERDGV